MDNINQFEFLKEIFENEKYFIVTSHTAPDGDNVGSSVAMTGYLREMQKKAYHVIDDSIPDNLNFLLEGHKFFTSEQFLDIEKYNCLVKSKEYVLIVLDTADSDRICISNEILQNAKYIVNIDHHVSNTKYGKINHIESEISSTCELVCKILRSIDEKKITSKIATALYTGISTDTGNFLFDSVDAYTFECASFLTKQGAERDTVANRIYQSTTYNYLQLTKESLETLEIYENIGLMLLSVEMLERNNVDYKDTDPLVQNVINIEGVSVGILIKERGENLYKISFRSKDSTNVCEIAQKFGGGGHKRAAGCTIYADLETVKKKVLEATKEQICTMDL